MTGRQRGGGGRRRGDDVADGVGPPLAWPRAATTDEQTQADDQDRTTPVTDPASASGNAGRLTEAAAPSQGRAGVRSSRSRHRPDRGTGGVRRASGAGAAPRLRSRPAPGARDLLDRGGPGAGLPGATVPDRPAGRTAGGRRGPFGFRHHLPHRPVGRAPATARRGPSPWWPRRCRGRCRRSCPSRRTARRSARQDRTGRGRGELFGVELHGGTVAWAGPGGGATGEDRTPRLPRRARTRAPAPAGGERPGPPDPWSALDHDPMSGIRRLPWPSGAGRGRRSQVSWQLSEQNQ